MKTEQTSITFEEGPWKLDMASVGALHEGCIEVSAASGRHFALATVAFELDSEAHSQGSSICRGNARLIAMAPSMFDILSRAQKHLEYAAGVSEEVENLLADLDSLFDYLKTDVRP